MAARRSRVLLDLTNFFLADAVGVVLPFLGDLLRQRHWRYDAVGAALAISGLGVFLLQTPAGFLVDRVRRRRQLLALASLVVGVSFALVPLVPARAWIVDPLLFVAGAAQAVFVPALAALALALVGHARLNREFGGNQSWNHLGNLAAALAAMAIVGTFGVAGVFYAVLVVSVAAAATALGIAGDEVDAAPAAAAATPRPRMRALLADRRVLLLIIAVALFHLANAPVMPLVALYVKKVGGSERQVAAVVLVAQAVMIPVALLAGRGCDRLGRKPIFLIGFVALPLRIFLYSLTSNASALVALQALDGIGAGIYGVAVVAMAADLTRRSGHFNALNGVFATAQALGAVVGPLVAGALVEHLGFVVAFRAFAGLAAVGAGVFLLVPETAPATANNVADPVGVC